MSASMPEALGIPSPHEIKVTQNWLIDFIVASGVCPPLIKLFQEHKRNHGGKVDWLDFPELVFVTFHKRNLKDSNLIDDVAEVYLRFVLDGSESGDLYSLIAVLPDFKNNRDYDKFIRNLKLRVINQLVTVEDNVAKMWDIMRRGALAQGIPEEKIQSDIINNKKMAMPGLTVPALRIVDNLFSMVTLYGKEVEDRDTRDIPLVRGERARYKILSRAPYYLLQTVHALPRIDLTGKLDVTKVHARNTAYAAEVRKRFSSFEKSIILLRKRS